MRRLVVTFVLLLGACSGDPKPSATTGESAKPAAKQPEPDVKQPEPDVKQPQPEPKQPEPETKQPELPPLDRSCKADSECVPAPSCCPLPCTTNVINKSAIDEARGRLECPQMIDCVSAGGCRTHAYLCVEGSCALVYEGDPGYRERP